MKERNHFIDVLKGILIIFVIVTHFPLLEAERNFWFFTCVIDLMIPGFMFITGYVYALSAQKSGVSCLGEAYSFSKIVDRVSRYIVPFSVTFIAEWILFRWVGVFATNVFEYGILALVMDYFRGGYGPGSYYIPVMLQLIFIFPVIYIVIKKFDFKGLLFCFAGNAVWEFLKTAYFMSEAEYRLMVFRYIFIVAAGCYLAIGEVKNNNKLRIISLCSFVVGLGFVYLFAYTAYQPKIVIYWKNTCFLVCLYVAPIMGFLIHNIKWKFTPLELFGKASFHIFLVQMVYYNFSDRMGNLIGNRGLHFVFNITNCLIVGVLFYYAENLVRKQIKTLITGKAS